MHAAGRNTQQEEQEKRREVSVRPLSLGVHYAARRSETLGINERLERQLDTNGSFTPDAATHGDTHAVATRV